jgi:hypothetical protein
MGTQPWLAHTQRQYAEMLLARGRRNDREKATELLTHAAEIAAELGMRPLLERVANAQARAQLAAST